MLTLRENDDLVKISKAFCAIYNTHWKVCQKLVDALQEMRTVDGPRRATNAKVSRAALPICTEPLEVHTHPKDSPSPITILHIVQHDVF